MNFSGPMVSIGLPVYNGVKYLAEAINSLLNQSFKNFELIISDNASTDATLSICREFEKQDKRIILLTNSRNIGIDRNHNKVLYAARGRYFHWAADDDMHDRNYLLRLFEEIDSDNSCVLCHSGVSIIDEVGAVSDTQLNLAVDRDPKRPWVTLDNILIRQPACYTFYGLYRRAALLRVGPLGNFRGSDRALLARLALTGTISFIPEPLFHPREHGGRYTRNQGDWRSWHAKQRGGISEMPMILAAQECLQSVSRNAASRRDRIRCRMVIIRWCLLPVNLYRTLIDLLEWLAPASAMHLRRLKHTIPSLLQSVWRAGQRSMVNARDNHCVETDRRSRQSRSHTGKLS